MDELKPCPFCGYKPELYPFVRDRSKWMIGCENPRCIMNCGDTVNGKGETVLDALPTEEDAIKAWNTRAREQALTDMLDKAYHFMRRPSPKLESSMRGSYCNDRAALYEEIRKLLNQDKPSE